MKRTNRVSMRSFGFFGIGVSIPMAQEYLTLNLLCFLVYVNGVHNHYNPLVIGIYINVHI